MSGRAPFAMPPVVLAMAGQALPRPAPLEGGVHAHVADVVRACLNTTPMDRPRMSLVLTRIGE